MLPVDVGDDPDKFLRCSIMQKLLPNQMTWNDGKGKGGKWRASSLPNVEPRICKCSIGDVTGEIVVLLIKPQARGCFLKFDEDVNRNGSMLCYRAMGIGKTESCVDGLKFEIIDRGREIRRRHYFALLRKVIPNATVSESGRSSGAYKLKMVEGQDVDSCSDKLVARTDGHNLRYEFSAGDCIGKYEVIEKIGQGGMGVVYRVRHVALGGEYALKAFMPTSGDCQMQKDRFGTEARLLKNLDHPGLPKVWDYDYDDRSECLFLVEDLITGGDGHPNELSKYTCLSENCVKSDSLRICEDKARQWLRQVCEIAVYLHNKGIEHRDMTLKNLLVDYNGNIKLTDFGIAKVLDDELRKRVGANVTMTFTQTPNGQPSFIGTIRYLPPEVRNKKKSEIDPEKTDVWAIGICFFRIVTGEWFDGQQFDELKGCNRFWIRIFKGMLNYDSGERLTCKRVLEILDERESDSDCSHPNLHAIWDKVILIDGDDVLNYGMESDEGAKLLYHMVRELLKRKYDVRVYISPGIIDAAKANNEQGVARYLISVKGMCRYVETIAPDVDMLEVCQMHACQIVSNRDFDDYRNNYPFLNFTDSEGDSHLRPYDHYDDDDVFTIDKIMECDFPRFDIVHPAPW